ncbi:hypothetical protein [Mobilicoccus massiliensis]|uniref:hypothetical protein n=1 Tax=Mobilicoccus massiliensis TaxID=1522310 RepID=UPI00058C1D45|nr:hypothetical protein [Mobilicoccus massiliensis]
MTHIAVSGHDRFEYQEMIVGIAHRRSGPTYFRRVTTRAGHSLQIGEVNSPMSALNEMGDEGWEVVREQPVVHEQHPWVVAELQEADSDVVSVSGSREYLLVRRLSGERRTE